MSPPARHPPVLVAGAGMAGLSAAWAVARAGVRVELFEAAPVVGGRFATHTRLEQRIGGHDGLFPIERGVHGFWPSYSTLLGFIDELGIRDHLIAVDEEDFVVVPDGGPVRRFEYGRTMGHSRLPAPFGALALLRHPGYHLALHDRGLRGIHLVGPRAAHAIAFDPAEDRGMLDGLRLSEHADGWPPAMWDLIASLSHSGFFTSPADACLPTFFEGLQHYVLERPGASAFSILDGDTESVMLGRVVEEIRSAGGKVHTGRTVEGLVFEGDRAVAARVRTRSRVDNRKAAAVILAVDPPAFRRLAERSGHPALTAIDPPSGAATTSVRLWFGTRPRRITMMGMLGNDRVSNYFWLSEFLGPYVRWARASGGAVVECHLYGPQSDWCRGRGDEEVARSVEAVVTSAWPELSGRRLHADVSRHAAAHTVMGPGFQLASPPVRTRTDNVLLCGDWVHPGWSCFYLERAAATGRLAAEGAARIAGGSLRPGDAARRPPPPARSFEVLRRVLRVARSLGLLVPPVSRARWREHRRRR